MTSAASMNQIQRFKQNSVKIKLGEKIIHTLRRGDCDNFICPAPCLVKSKWPGYIQAHCKSCKIFLHIFNSVTESASFGSASSHDNIIESPIIDDEIIAPASDPLSTTVSSIETEPQAISSYDAEYPCHPMLIAGSALPLVHNPRYNCIICHLCKYILPNVNAIEFHFKKHHKNQSFSFNDQQLMEWIESNCPLVLNMALTNELIATHSSVDVGGITGIPLLPGFQCYFCDYASIALSSMRKHIYKSHSPNAPFKHVKV